MRGDSTAPMAATPSASAAIRTLFVVLAALRRGPLLVRRWLDRDAPEDLRENFSGLLK